MYFVIGTKLKLMKFVFNSVNYVKSAKNTQFLWFGGSADFTEASAELFRPILTEASAEASVSVVHYFQDFAKIRFKSARFNSIYLNGAQSFGTTCSTQVCDWCLLLRQLESFIERFGQWITMRTDKLKMRISWKQLDYVRNAEACHRKRQACFEWTFTRLNFYEKKTVLKRQ